MTHLLQKFPWYVVILVCQRAKYIVTVVSIIYIGPIHDVCTLPNQTLETRYYERIPNFNISLLIEKYISANIDHRAVVAMRMRQATKVCFFYQITML